MSQSKKYYLRFSVSQRIEHWLQVFSFTLLAITGLPQKFLGDPWAEAMIAAMGGIELVRIYHRVAAFLMLLGMVYHALYVGYQMFVKRAPLTMLPSWQDAKDFYSVLSYNLGLKGAWPKMPRYNFEEKAEYWAFVWGAVVMALTGFMLWNPIATANFFPGSFIPAAKAAHGGEALLAVLAIIVWHFYGVHLRKFNKSMFTGKLSRDEMAHEHALELEEIDGNGYPEAPADEVARRRRVFIPVGTIVAILLLGGVYWFVSFEQTAISTVPIAAAAEEPFQPLELQTGGNMHNLITEYNGPESCAASNCHSGERLATAINSEHSKKVAANGSIPILAKVEHLETNVGDTTPDCLLCHAETYYPDDPLASVHTVRAAGHETCRRCHSTHTTEGTHDAVGLGCSSCHASVDHDIEVRVSCTSCHNELPHTDPLINNHTRLDCRSCHIRAGGAGRLVDVTEPVQNSETGIYLPSVEAVDGPAQFMWQTESGQPSTIDDANARIVPVVSITVLAPKGLDPVEFAATGEASGEAVETTIQLVPSHGASPEVTRTCASCHGPESDFDFAGLGYPEEVANQLSAVPEQAE
ncbi:MAG: hypothetical protein Kow0031_07030 [Anaerolineae bacterium]